LANYIVEFTEIDEIWFLVSPQNPLKSGDKLSDEQSRLEMTKLALRKYAKFKVSDFEFSMPKPSYTIDTLRALREKYPNDTFSLIIGADNWSVFESWREYDKIWEEFALKVYPRLGSRITIPNKLKYRVKALDSPIVEMSSTFIRESIAEGKNISAFLPEGVYEYIIEKGLYK
jgi:nicotinate-nucleotide adenylyltransferase